MKNFLDETLERAGIALCEYGMRITLFGFCAVHIEGHKGLLDYCAELVVVKGKSKRINIVGKKLSVKEITEDEMFISGKITSLECEDVG